MPEVAVLIAAIDRLLEASVRPVREERLAPVEKRLERDLALAFRAEGRAFLRGFRNLADPAKFPLDEPQWVRYLVAAQAETLTMYTAALNTAVSDALMAGVLTAVEGMPEGAAAEEALREAGWLTRIAGWLAKQVGVIFGIRFDLRNPRAVAYLEAHGAELVANIDETTRDYIRTVLAEGTSKGWSYDQMAKRISERYKEFAVGRPQLHIDSRAHMVAVTECFPGDVLVAPFSRPIPSLLFPTASATFFGARDGAGPEAPIRWAARRWYEGSLIEIATASGNKLTGTPNHPVLTDRGWVAIDALTEGDYVICCGSGQGMGIRDPYIEDVPAAFSKVFHALQDYPGVGAKRIAASSMDFHGDGGEGYIDIVGAYGNLLPHDLSAVAEPIGQEALAVSDLDEPLLAGQALGRYGAGGLRDALAHSGELTHSPSGRCVSVGEKGVSLRERARRPEKSAGLGIAAEVNAGTLEDCGDVVGGNAIPDTDSQAGFAGQITRDRIVSINKKPGWSGHVYNLHTLLGYYTANGVIVQNCGNAYAEGNLQVAQGLAAAGLRMEKSWQTVGDSKVSELCRGNEAEGWIPLDQTFTSGHMRPLAHPACRCDLLTRRVGAGG